MRMTKKRKAEEAAKLAEARAARRPRGSNRQLRSVLNTATSSLAFWQKNGNEYMAARASATIERMQTEMALRKEEKELESAEGESV